MSKLITPELLERLRKVAGKLAGKVDEGDLFGAGLMGLAQAVRRWEDEGMVGDFDAYAITAARNAMKQEMRDREAYLAGAKDIFELEERIRRLERSTGSRYY